MEKCTHGMEIKNPEFAVHMLNNEGKVKAAAIQQIFDRSLNALKLLCPDGRQMSIVKTKLEEACFFAKKAVAVNPENQTTA